MEEVLDSIKPLFSKEPKYLDIVETVCEPERVITFRVPWIDDKVRFLWRCVTSGF